MSATLVHIYRYPIKGMTAEPLARVRLEPGQRLPGDRQFAVAHGSGMELAPSGAWQPKSSFLMLMRNERLARLEARYDPATGFLVLLRGGKQVARGNLREPLGRTLIEQFLAAFMKAELRGAPKLFEASAGGFTDCPAPWCSIVNLASLRDLEERLIRAPVDPLRFRANLYIEGVAAWHELEWVGREIAVGSVRLAVVKRITRCAAPNVNPATATRDLNIPRALADGLGHGDLGVYAEALTAGEIAPGDPVIVPSS